MIIRRSTMAEIKQATKRYRKQGWTIRKLYVSAGEHVAILEKAKKFPPKA